MVSYDISDAFVYVGESATQFVDPSGFIRIPLDFISRGLPSFSWLIRRMRA
jgi:hypothetical protein